MSNHGPTGLNTLNDTSRELTSANFSNRLRMQNLFGAGSSHRKNFLENYQFRMSWAQYKKMVAKKYSKSNNKNKKQKKDISHMTFGKFKGWLIKDIKTNYLRWVIDNVKADQTNKSCLAVVRSVLKRRKKVAFFKRKK